MKTNSSENKDPRWLKTPVANLVRHIQSGNYYARIRVRGKLIWKSLKTDCITVAKMRLSDFHKAEREKATTVQALTRGKMTFGDATAAYKRQRKNDPNLKEATVEYDDFRIKALFESWPDLENTEVTKISGADCLSWSLKNAKKVSSSSHNHTVGILRSIFKIAIESGARYDNPALAAKWVKEHTKKQIKLPEPGQFEMIVKEIRKSGNRRYANISADLVEFLAYGGFRKGEAQNITWADCDFAREKIIVRGSPVTGLKGRQVGESRVVPMIADMRRLLERIKNERMNARPNDRIMLVTDCKKSINAACKELGISRFTHHDLRHLFATRCIEAGVDIPTVSRWLGHKDSGALAMKVYGHLRDEHSTTMAQKVVFSENVSKVIPLASSAVAQNNPTSFTGSASTDKKAVAQAKAKYNFPWWASKNVTEIFWGQANELVQIVSLAKYLESAKQSMGRIVFEEELADPAALLDEFAERAGTSYIEKLKAKISVGQKQQAA